MYSPPYAAPPLTYMSPEYKQTTYISPPPAGPGAFHSSKQPQIYCTPTKDPNMARRSSHDTSPFTYVSPRGPQYYTPPTYTYAPVEDVAFKYASPKRNDFASVTERMRSKAHRYDEGPGSKFGSRSSMSKKTMRNGPEIFVVEQDDAYDSSPDGSPPPPYHQYTHDRHYSDSAYYARDQKRPARKDPEPAPQRGRSRTTSTTKIHISQKSKPSRQSPPRHLPLKATAEDAARAGIPAGYSYKNWDPSEAPIFLLGSVFDANSLGKWIYDWTVFHYGPSTPLADLAGELWLLLIQLAGKTKRAKECTPRVRRRDNLELVEEFIASGDRLWNRLIKILKVCEDDMWGVAKKEKSGKKSVSMGANSGRAFVNSMFGRDRELEDTEELMQSMRLWSWRFDDNCEGILRRPGA